MRLVSLLVFVLACGPKHRGEPHGPPIRTVVKETRGKELFGKFCYKCHPNGATGLGPAINDKPLPEFALETQIRTAREKLAQKDTHRDAQIETVYYDLTADEIYATYAKGWQPEEVRAMDHTQIASRLMLEHGLTQDAADFAADQILLVAETLNDGE